MTHWCSTKPCVKRTYCQASTGATEAAVTTNNPVAHANNNNKYIVHTHQHKVWHQSQGETDHHQWVLFHQRKGNSTILHPANTQGRRREENDDGEWAQQQQQKARARRAKRTGTAHGVPSVRVSTGSTVKWYSLRSKSVSPPSGPCQVLEMLVLVDSGTKATRRWLTWRVFDYIGEHKKKTSKLKATSRGKKKQCRLSQKCDSDVTHWNCNRQLSFSLQPLFVHVGNLVIVVTKMDDDFVQTTLQSQPYPVDL